MTNEEYICRKYPDYKFELEVEHAVVLSDEDNVMIVNLYDCDTNVVLSKEDLKKIARIPRIKFLRDMTTQKWMSSSIFESINAIIEYVKDDERKHYDECDEEEQERHIYNDIADVSVWLESFREEYRGNKWL